ncbi:MAG TPA: hypothetical protein VF903_06305 [Nitrospirota bacterium]
MRKLKILAAVLTAASLFVFFTPHFRQGLPTPGIAHAQAQDDWRSEFEALCARTQDSAGLPVEELKSLVERCDKLKPRIEKLEESQRKVYLKRLQMCRDLYAFVLESREKNATPAP